jgi:hypothetical protein
VRAQFALHAGYVRSRHDGDRHYIGVGQLIRLYRLRPGEYVIWDHAGQMGRRWDDYKHLFPRDDGNYGRPEL